VTKANLSDPRKQIVADGYDRLVERYVEWASTAVADPVRTRSIEMLEQRLPAGSRILDLGCGTGELVTRRLATRYPLTGVDLSPAQIERARERTPHAHFICADMAEVRFRPASFDAILALYSLNHLPREELGAMLTSIAGWLRPSGVFVASFPVNDVSGVTERDWLGVPMYFSGFNAETNRALVEGAGLEVERFTLETIEEEDQPVKFAWARARKPSSP
jgi:SAM-dependent methyltransferase